MTESIWKAGIAGGEEAGFKPTKADFDAANQPIAAARLSAALSKDHTDTHPDELAVLRLVATAWECGDPAPVSRARFEMALRRLAEARSEEAQAVKFTLAVFAAFVVAIGLFIWWPEGPSQTVVLATTAAPEGLTAAEIIEKTRFLKVSIAAKTLKNAMREPESVEWIDIRADETASVICLHYRARNGFGGMNVEQAVVLDGRFYDTGEAWDQQCAGKKLINMRFVRGGL